MLDTIVSLLCVCVTFSAFWLRTSRIWYVLHLRKITFNACILSCRTWSLHFHHFVDASGEGSPEPPLIAYVIRAKRAL